MAPPVCRLGPVGDRGTDSKRWEPEQMGLETFSDEELLEQIQAAAGQVVAFGLDDPARCQAAWASLIAGIRELETRYPPEPLFSG